MVQQERTSPLDTLCSRFSLRRGGPTARGRVPKAQDAAPSTHRKVGTTVLNRNPKGKTFCRYATHAFWRGHPANYTVTCTDIRCSPLRCKPSTSSPTSVPTSATSTLQFLLLPHSSSVPCVSRRSIASISPIDPNHPSLHPEIPRSLQALE